MGRLSASVVVPRPQAEVFAFFAEAGNLQRITPPWVDFRIVTAAPIAMQPGALIDYRLRIRGVPIGWRSEITTWDPPHRFVDEQRKGPYRRWVHTHSFRTLPEGTLVEDDVAFHAWGGRMVERLFVARDVAAIFRYRQQAILDAFGVTAVGPVQVEVS